MALFESHVLNRCTAFIHIPFSATSTKNGTQTGDEIMEFNETINYKVSYQNSESIIEIEFV